MMMSVKVLRVTWGLFGGMLVLWASADVMALPDYTHTSRIRNNTGRVANDLHINVPTKPTGNPMAPPFTVATNNFRTIDFSGGNVAAGGSTNVTWFSKQARDRILSGNWTFNGANIGILETAALVPDFQRLEDGQWAVLVDNQNEFPVEYDNLHIATGIDRALFDPLHGNYLNHLEAGIPTTPPEGLTGVLAPGLNELAVVRVDTAGYTAGRINLPGLEADEIPLGIAAIPEPSTLIMAVLLAPMILVRRRR